MTEEICPQGHVIDNGSPTCSRCGGQSIGYTENAPVLDEVAKTKASKKTTKPEKVSKSKVAKKAEKAEKAKKVAKKK